MKTAEELATEAVDVWVKIASERGQRIDYLERKLALMQEERDAALRSLRGEVGGENDHGELGVWPVDKVNDLERKLAVAKEALEKARSELGVPQPGYPAPVANAADIISAALEEINSTASKEK